MSVSETLFQIVPRGDCNAINPPIVGVPFPYNRFLLPGLTEKKTAGSDCDTEKTKSVARLILQTIGERRAGLLALLLIEAVPRAAPIKTLPQRGWASEIRCPASPNDKFHVQTVELDSY